MKGLDAVAAIGASGISDPEQLLKWIAKSRLDPNDPANADLMAMLRVRHVFSSFGVRSCSQEQALLVDGNARKLLKKKKTRKMDHRTSWCLRFTHVAP